MRRSFAALFLALMILPVMAAEEGPDSEVLTYFLIDASGSMAEELPGSAPTISKGARAENLITALIAERSESSSHGLFSKTYFRAKNRDLCWHPVRISTPITREELDTSPRRYENDFTPLGAALESAILNAGDRPADIFLISDGIQTPDCGPDICEVARKHLPVSGIDVIPVIVSEAEAGPNPLACIDEAEDRPVTVKVQATGDKGSEEETNTSWMNSRIVRKTFVFFEKWWWLIGLISLGWSAIGIGRRESERAQILEDGSERARSYQKLIRENDSQALNDLNTMVVEVKKSLLKMGPTRSKKINQPAEADNEKAIKDMPLGSLDRGFRIRRVLTDYPLGVFGAITITWIALLPNEIGHVGLEGTKSAAWDALNSQFATAFAVTWIAIIFFASNQNHRRREALHKFQILTDEAKRVEAIEKREARAAAFKKYDRQLNDLRNLDFTELDDILASIDDPAISAEVSKNADLVKRTSLAAAAGKELGETNETSELMSASNRLASLIQSSRWSRLDYPTFISRLRNTHSLTDNLTEWENLEKALKYNNSETKVVRINELAETIRADRLPH
ncbi:MAG TPA: hypothetical protein DHV57_05915 [Hyphomonas sp.]|jgi:hypothetical protein|uniref:hypothetical protein n=1 Tax=unclassified Hyphomonas TaxID=2630699 RepID=UPI000C35DFEF|nr:MULTISPECIES: hypothetical protein [unclassified Hyphomonas]MAN90788.1 hypothetical protein [Hyphomonadaceae bacterium]MBG67997.1 hypothetical protein [Hyphomonas sp.]HCJ16941.1 hypothetical protein [Hyphomonas sp.]HCN92240.1 hypothetical protein [Hyphomonas sp.]|tara:strand:- start:160 stop:1860 length:1701 start_codon:yes stop_codon:yes gene_type:complete